MRRAVAGAIALGGLWAAPESARAEEPRPSVQVGIARVVVLKNGQRYVGVMVDHQPGSHVRLRLASGQVLVFVLDTVAELRAPRPDDEALASAVSAEPTHGPAPSAAPGPPEAWVRAHLLDEGLRLESSDNTYASDKSEEEWTWSFACDSPCGEWVSRQRYYRLRVPDAVPTRPFRMAWEGALREYATPPSELNVRYLDGRLQMRQGGVALLIIGPALMLFGGIFPMGIGSIRSDRAAIVGGGAGFGIGLGSTILGVVLFTVGKNRVSIVPRPGTVGAPP